MMAKVPPRIRETPDFLRHLVVGKRATVWFESNAVTGEVVSIDEDMIALNTGYRTAYVLRKSIVAYEAPKSTAPEHPDKVFEEE
jgi:uncharacterized protein YrrD